MTLTYRLYAALANAAAPFAFRKVAKKLAQAAVPADRIAERKGQPSLERPAGHLVWCHAASVGECLSALTLIKGLLRDNPDIEILLTSGTATSAEVLAPQMPARCRHQFAPLDSAKALRRFLQHWRPDMAIFVESELWPQMLVRTRALGIPMVLMNARLSKGSLKNWGKFPQTAQKILACFDRIHTQDQATQDGLRALSAQPDRIAQGPNLKSAAEPLRFDPDLYDQLRTDLTGRPCWLAASTHPGEEEVVLKAHQTLLAQHPDLMLILVPRHPERAPDITEMITQHGLSFSQRSVTPVPSQQVYLADTMGEMGLWYNLCPTVFLGGSLVPVGGHNPFEPAHSGAVVLHGPLFANFAESYAAFAQAGGNIEIDSAETLAASVHTLLSTPQTRNRLGALAKDFAQSQNDGLDALIAELGQMMQ
ncbi:MAG: 3-deoxy-D-manno-octulosonic acid transferase [Thalassovita sp.]